VALTLPEGVIATLRAIDGDLGRAVVRLAASARAAAPTAELSAFGDRAVIVVPSSPTLRERIGVDLVPLADGRCLISFDRQVSAQDIELRVHDALADAALPPAERPLFAALAGILRDARRSGRTALQERSIIVVRQVRRRPSAGGRIRRSVPAE
jgi:hypothetical protein